MEDDSIIFVCEECSKKMYPRKGKFSVKELEKADFVKADFNGGHMWIKDIVVSKEGITGIVDNVPICPISPKLGEKVFIAIGEIEDIDWRID